MSVYLTLSLTVRSTVQETTNVRIIESIELIIFGVLILFYMKLI